MTQVEATKYEYQVVDGFFKRPTKWAFVEVADVDVDADDNVYVFNRSNHPVMIFDKHGNFLDAWGEMSEHYFSVPHGLSLGPDGSVYTADTGDHTVRKWTKEGKLLMTLGRINLNSPEYSGTPFNRPTHLTVASNGDLYASDGYGNAHIYCFDQSGQLKFSWGGHGSGPGEFDTIHSVFVDRRDGDTVYAADRYNNRVQFFTRDGQFLGQWGDLVLPNSVRRGRDGVFYIAELGHRITVCQPDGVVLARWGEEAEVKETNTAHPALKHKVVHEPGAGKFAAPHGIAVDSEGSIYVAETAESFAGLDRGNRCIQKFVHVLS